ncbi:threonine--tRNA ligase [Mycoplasma sp. SG1]|uniref:threonine--tRNA ligase n=1 Tax=Mycoplasma sp. SG1 TaxID=2810348 RepID=UPI0020248284|nr:threonine--tRNA ligase [Mycoplasma sp. SG1]URM53197.1 threonine--tRNA ligase [Mycoplasma sp. SG1]
MDYQNKNLSKVIVNNVEFLISRDLPFFFYFLKLNDQSKSFLPDFIKESIKKANHFNFNEKTLKQIIAVQINNKDTIGIGQTLSFYDKTFCNDQSSKIYKLDFIVDKNDLSYLDLLNNSAGLLALLLIQQHAKAVEFKPTSDQENYFFDPYQSLFFNNKDEERFKKLFSLFNIKPKDWEKNISTLVESFEKLLINPSVQLITKSKSIKQFKIKFYVISDSLDNRFIKSLQKDIAPILKAILNSKHNSFFDAKFFNIIFEEHTKQIHFQNQKYDNCKQFCGHTIVLKESCLGSVVDPVNKPVVLNCHELSHFSIFNHSFKAVQITDAKILNAFQICYGKSILKPVFEISLIGTCAPSKTNLKENLDLYNKNALIDHRFLGKELDLYFFEKNVGLGFPIWLPNGTIIKDKIKVYLRKKYLEYGFQFVNSPVLGSKNLYLKSGHLKRYYNCMFSEINIKDHAQLDGNFQSLNSDIENTFFLRPMTCPHHCLIFNHLKPSYKDLPVKLVEESPLFRHEYSGALSGLERVRGMELFDAHIFCLHQQIEKLVLQLLHLITEVLNKFQIKFYYSLSLGDSDDGADKHSDLWHQSELMLKNCLEQFKAQKKIDYVVNYGEAAFYGPKIDLQINTIWNHEITIATLQLDYLLPTSDHLNVIYIDKNNQQQHPVLIHFGIIGTFERFISVLLEQFGGLLPLFISPVQIQIIPVLQQDEKISQKISTYSKHISNVLIDEGFRVKYDDSEERLNYKIRYGQIKKIPYQLIIGQNELHESGFENHFEFENALISFRQCRSNKTTKAKLSHFLNNLKTEIKTFLS